MSDRIRTVLVVLDDDYRDDNLGDILAAIRMVRGVAAVKLGAAVSHTDYSARLAIAGEVGDALHSVAHALYLGKRFTVEVTP